MNLASIAQIAQRFGVKVAQGRTSEHVVRPHSTLHSSTSALGVVCAACVLLEARNLSKTGNVAQMFRHEGCPHTYL